MTEAPSRTKAKAAARARVLEQFEHDWAEAERLATTYPELFRIIAPAAAFAGQADPANPRASSLEPQKNEREAFDGTLRGLIARYKTDPDSTYHKLRFRTRENYNALLRRIEKDHGSEPIASLDARRLKAIHEGWTAGGKRIAMAHSLVTMLRTLSTFGATWLKSNECRELKTTLAGMEFKMPIQRNEKLTAEHAIAIRKKAHELGLSSIALAQAIQFEIRLHQKDVIGEWVPISEQGTPSDVIDDNMKWLRGLRWNEIDENLILRHATSTLQRTVEFDLKLYPMVMEELALLGERPTDSRPVIIRDDTGIPWTNYEFRRQWRKMARAAGVPDTVYNMDSRAPARLDRLAPAYRHLRRQETESPR